MTETRLPDNAANPLATTAATPDAPAGAAGDTAVRVEASGSQSTYGSQVVSNQLSVKIEPLYGFVE